MAPVRWGVGLVVSSGAVLLDLPRKPKNSVTPDEAGCRVCVEGERRQAQSNSVHQQDATLADHESAKPRNDRQVLLGTKQQQDPPFLSP
jgi:hypothetical protein